MSALRVSLDASAIPDPAGGAGRYVLALAGALHGRDDVDLTVVCRAGDAGRWPTPVVAAAPTPRPVRLAWEQVGLPLVLHRGLRAVDVHHSPHYTMPLAAGRPVVVTVHDLSFFTHPEWHQPAKVALFRTAIRLAAARAAALVAVSEATAGLLRSLVAPRAPIAVIPHGVDHSRFTPTADRDADAAALARCGVVPPYVAFLGTLEPRKDVPTLVRAFDRVAAARPDLSLVLAGAPGWGADAVDAAVAAAGHRDRVHRLGFVAEDDVPALLRGAAAVCYASLEEGFGLPVLEGLACGAPVVTTVGTVMEEVAAGAAVLARPGDVDSLAEALDVALTGGAAAATRRRQGLDVAARHTWEASAEAHVEIYRAAKATR